MPTERPSARDAVAVLRQRFRGFDPTSPPDDEPTVVGDPGGALELHALREGRAGELADRLAVDEAAARFPVDSFVPGEPGRRTRSNASAAMSALVGRNRLERLGAEAAADPDTGVAEQARVKGVQDTLDEAATTARPELTDASHAVSQRNAFGAFLKSKGLKMGEYEAAASPAAQAAAEVPLRAQASDVGERLANEKLEREQQLRMSPSLVPGQMPVSGGAGAVDVGGGFTAPPNLKPPSATTERQLGDMQMVAPLVTSLEKLLDPTKNEVSDALTTRAKWGLYKLGVTPNMIGGDERDQARMQLASLISVAGATPYMRGTRAFQYLQQIQKHLTDPTATDAFLYQNIQELKSQWPKMYQKILQAHYNPGAPLTFDEEPDAAAAPPAPAATNRRDPNRGM